MRLLYFIFFRYLQVFNKDNRKSLNFKVPFEFTEIYEINSPEETYDSYALNKQNTKFSFIKVEKLAKRKIPVAPQIKIENIFSSSFINSIETKNDNDSEYIENIIIINEVRHQNHLYSVHSLNREQFLTEIFKNQFSQTDIKYVSNSCIGKTNKIYARLMPNVKIYIFVFIIIECSWLNF